MRLVTNLKRFPAQWTASDGTAGEAQSATTTAEFLAAAQTPDTVLLVNCDPDVTFQLCGELRGKPAPAIVALDLVLRRPASLPARFLLPRKRRLLQRVDHFIHYFQDVRGLTEVFGITAERSSFVPFKVNLPPPEVLPGDGEYVLCFGRSLRDYDTFFAALESLPYPGAIAEPDVAQLRQHGARFTRDRRQWPANLRLLPDDNTAAAQVRILSGAKVVVLPVVRQSLVASGVSTCLNAMLYGRCVILSEGPGASDVFGERILTVPPEDPTRLAAQITRAWEDDALRRRLAAAGRQYAVDLGGEPELYQRIIDAVSAWRRRQTP